MAVSAYAVQAQPHAIDGVPLTKVPSVVISFIACLPAQQQALRRSNSRYSPLASRR